MLLFLSVSQGFVVSADLIIHFYEFGWKLLIMSLGQLFGNLSLFGQLLRVFLCAFQELGSQRELPLNLHFGSGLNSF